MTDVRKGYVYDYTALEDMFERFSEDNPGIDVQMTREVGQGGNMLTLRISADIEGMPDTTAVVESPDALVEIEYRPSYGVEQGDDDPIAVAVDFDGMQKLGKKIESFYQDSRYIGGERHEFLERRVHEATWFEPAEYHEYHCEEMAAISDIMDDMRLDLEANRKGMAIGKALILDGEWPKERLKGMNAMQYGSSPSYDDGKYVNHHNDMFVKNYDNDRTIIFDLSGNGKNYLLGNPGEEPNQTWKAKVGVADEIGDMMMENEAHRMGGEMPTLNFGKGFRDPSEFSVQPTPDEIEKRYAKEVAQDREDRGRGNRVSPGRKPSSPSPSF